MHKRLLSISIILILIIMTCIPVFADAAFSLEVQLNNVNLRSGDYLIGVGYLLADGKGDSGQIVAALIESADGLARVSAKQFEVKANGSFDIYMDVRNYIKPGSYTLKVSARNIIVVKGFTVTAQENEPDDTPTVPNTPSGPPNVASTPPSTVGTQSGNSVTAPVPNYDSAKGSASTNLDGKLLDAAIHAAGGSNGEVKNVVVNVPAITGAKEYKIGIDSNYLTSTDSTATSVFEVKTNLATLSVPNNMFSTEEMGQGKKVELVVAKADTNNLSSEIKDKIGNKPVFELNVLVDGKKEEWSNPNAPITIAFDYTPTAEEAANPDNIVVWYIDGSGNVVTVSNAKYDPETGKLTFSTTHFSKYAVAYSKKNFTDLGNYAAWSAKEINLVVAKDMLKSKSETAFEPGNAITRGEFIYGLVRALNLNTKAAGNFEDVKSTDYYFNELAIAKKLGIANGVGNNMYKPGDKITRQDMATLIDKSLKIAKKQTKIESDISKFADSKNIAPYAVESMKAMVAEGILKGDGININPRGNTTRAETAIILYRIFNK